MGPDLMMESSIQHKSEENSFSTTLCGVHLLLMMYEVSASVGALDGDPQCRMLILRNGKVPCRSFHNFHVDF